MTYEQLRQYAKPHIRQGAELPSNAFILLHQLHILYKDQEQCQKDYGGKMTPLYNHPAFLAITDNEKVIYFNTNARYWNFYLFHEISHYLLGHEDDFPQQEADANMLACILIAPVENLPSALRSARDLSALCKIPIDKAEVYWQEIKDKISKWYKRVWVIGCIIGTIIFSIILSFYFKNYPTTSNNIEETSTITTPAPDVNIYSQDDLFYITSSGTHYHLKDCKHIKYKNNTIHISKDEADKFNLEPCDDCIK